MGDALDKTVKYEQLLISRLTIVMAREIDHIRNNNPVSLLPFFPFFSNLTSRIFNSNLYNSSILANVRNAIGINYRLIGKVES